MVIIRRLYIFLVCAVSLQATVWAVIVLLGDLLTTRTQPVSSTALQIAIVVIGLPIFLVHWLWAQRLARHEDDERAAAMRRLYLYGTLAASLAPFSAVAFDLCQTLLMLAFGVTRPPWQGEASTAIVRDLVTLATLALVWFYHQRIGVADQQTVPEQDLAATIRRLYIFGFAGAGLTVVGMAAIQLLRWVMFLFTQLPTEELAAGLARLVIGLPLWLAFWLWAQRLFAGESADEHESVVRKIYLYATVFTALSAAIGGATIILAGFLRNLLGLPSQGDIRDPLSVAIVTAVLWAYHAYILRRDIARIAEVTAQATVRRLYLYLVAALSLGAFLIGLGGDISVLIRLFTDAGFGLGLREQLAWFTASLIAGLVVWIWPWRQAQTIAEDEGGLGMAERRSFVRKIYLYGYLFAATMTVLAGAVYIMFRLLSLALGESASGNLFNDLAQAIAFILIAIGVWLYHGYALRTDGRLTEREQAARRQALRVVVVDAAEGRFGRAVLDALRRELPGVSCVPMPLTPAAAQAMDATPDTRSLAAQLSEASLIVGSWQITAPGSAEGSVTAELATAVAQSPARKLLVPQWDNNWNWVGAERLSADAVVRHTIRAIKQALAGEEIKGASTNIGASIGIILIVLVSLCVLAQLIPALLFRAF